MKVIGKRREKLTLRRILTMSMCICLLVEILMGSTYAQETEVMDYGKDKALEWLEQQGDEDGKWGEDSLPNLTCNAVAVLNLEGEIVQSAFLEDWLKDEKNQNIDELAHLVWAYGDETFLHEIQEQQNEDGGFGINGNYTSDVYDTFLVLSAITYLEKREDIELSGDWKEMKNKAVYYLMGQQNEDGGYSYTKANASDSELTAEIGIILSQNEVANEDLFAKLDTYCQSAYCMDFSEERFDEQVRIARYLYMREIIEHTAETEVQLAKVLSEDGSVHGDIEDTIQYILLCKVLENYYALDFQVLSMKTKADSYVLEVGEEQKVNLTTNIEYQINQEQTGTIRYYFMQGAEELLTWEEICSFMPEETTSANQTEFSVCAEADSQYTLRVELWGNDAEEENICRAIEEIDFYLHAAESGELVLECNSTEPTEHTSNLCWNDLSNDDGRYGYRLYRRTEDGEWETCSAWDGEETVRVLNVYSTNGSQVCLTNWMNEPTGDMELPAGLGLFEIDIVSIRDYNVNPDKYLKDENGEYQYDVLVFGFADCNGHWDLNETGYEGTKAFVEAGGGVLFGHDTVSINTSANHPYFARFAEDMGIILKRDGHPGTTSEVKVIKEGILSSYPWELSGTLVIPPMHTSGQYVGGTAGGTIWMECQHPYETDEETGAVNNGYLIVSDSLAIIQTGHSNKYTTDDERKVLANTLFYLKQLTGQTTASDKFFYDSEVPNAPSVEQQGMEMLITATDNGTTYDYYIEAIPMGENDATEKIESNILSEEACSGIQGFIVGVSNSEEPMEELIVYEEDGTLVSDIITAENGSIRYDFSHSTLEEETYLHVYAVDNAGNISEEMTVKLEEAITEPVIPEEPEVPEEPGGYLDTEYALFSAEDTIMYCSNAELYGEAYAGTSMTFGGSSLLTIGAIHSTGAITTYAGNTSIAERIEYGEARSLPDYREDVLADMTADDSMQEIAVYNSTSIQSPIHCQSTSGAYCPELVLGANLYAEESVYISTAQATFGEEIPVVVCSAHGDININATALTGRGLIYAPEGTVTINVSQLDFRGSIIAKRICLQGDTLRVGTERE
ncbi:MAG: DUF5057 domain-containing protein [Lachnospiraceae bacterium]|nr:DUF5057 domain-containing protein [Lachnospiraceae bacterium]